MPGRGLEIHGQDCFLTGHFKTVAVSRCPAGYSAMAKRTLPRLVAALVARVAFALNEHNVTEGPLRLKIGPVGGGNLLDSQRPL